MTTTQNNGLTSPQPPVGLPPPPLPTIPTNAPSSDNRALPVPPGWRFQPGSPGTMIDSRAVVEGRVIDPSTIHNGGLSPEYAAQKGKNSFKALLASNTVQGPASIVELAAALKNDPQLIFEFVYNNIDWQPGWGVMKGALGALLDGSGNAFDQSMLLVALLRQAGYTANYVLGQIQLTTTQYDAWFGTDSTSNSYCCYWYAQYANIPGNTPTWTGTNWIMTMGHVWVQVVIAGTTYVLDPSLKTYTRKTPLANLGTVLGYNATTFLTDAQSGATIDGAGNFVQNMNSAKIAADLSTFSANLQTYIKNNAIGSAPAGTATVDDVLGGAAIVPLTLPFVWQTALSYEAPGDTPTVWSGDVPLAYKTTLQVQYPLAPSGWAINQTFTSDQLAGGRLTLTFDGSLRPVLTLNGTAVATGSQAQSPGSWNSLLLTVNHNAYASPVYPRQWWQSYIYAGQFYLIGNAWGNLGRGQSDFHQTQLAAALANPAATSEQLNGEYMSALWFSWASQASRVADLVGRLRNTYMNFFHQVGIISLSYSGGVPTPTTDIGGVSGFSSTLNYDFTQLAPTNSLVAMHGVALEAAAVAQFNGTAPGVSTTTVIDKANRTAVFTLAGTATAGDVLTITVLDAALSGGSRSDNHTVSAGESPAAMATALASAINGDTVLAAIGVSASANGANLEVSSTSANQTSYSTSVSGAATETLSVAWSKIYRATSANWATGINISNILTTNGVDSGTISNIGFYINTDGYPVLVPDQPYYALGSQNADGYWALPPYANNGGAFGLINTVVKGAVGQPKPGKKTPPPPPPPPPPVGDPINPFSGAFTLETKDLNIGSGPEPYQLSFERYYSSDNQYENGTLGWGWDHNHDMGVQVGSDGLLTMGCLSALPGAPTLAELYVASDLASDTSQPIVKVVTMSLAGKWWLDQLVNNTVWVSTDTDSYVFTRLPSGAYASPANNAATLTLAAGVYTMTTPQKVQYQFNSVGQIASIVYPYGVTVGYSYSGGMLASVTNGMGRTLTFGYTGALLTSVSDGTGRSIGFSYDAFGNLTACTDALTNQVTYQYDQPGRLTQVYYPANPLTAVVNNTYDSLSRVKTQANGRGQIWNYYFAGARSEQVDPLGNRSIWYFNRFAAVTKSLDPLGNKTAYVLDGLNRPIQITLPEGNQTLFTYDANNNILTRTRVPKAGSGLSNVVETYTYDTTWARVKTYKDGRLNTWTYSYDASLGNLLQIQKPAVAAGTPVVTMTYNGRGQMLTSTDETGIVTKYNYDVATEVMTSKIVDYSVAGGHLNLTTQFSFDSVGNLTAVTDPNGNTTAFQFDPNRRITQRSDAAPFSYITALSYDANGNRLSIQRQTASPAWQVRSYTYSATNKLLSETDPAGKTKTLVYDGKDRLQYLTDAQGRTWQRSYDACDRLSQFNDPSLAAFETRTYTNNGLLASRKDGNNNTTQYTYDGLDRLNKTIYADATFEQNSSYDANGNVLTHLTRSGGSITNTYDALNNLLTKAPGGQPTITSTYDRASRLTQMSKAGTVGSDPSIGALQFFFDGAGRFFKEQYPDGKTVTHVLDGNGNRTRTTWPDGYFITRIFDQLNRLTGIQLNGSGVNAATIAYNQLSQRTQLTFANGVVTSLNQMPNSDVTGITYNFVGSNVTFSYGFNSVNEAVSLAISDNTYIWAPGAAGTTAYGTADNVNKYPNVAGVSYSYDGNKNLTGDGTWTYAYDTENHLLSASGPSSVTMVYDPLHRQSQKKVASTKTRYLYSDWQRIADYNGTTGSLLTRYIYGVGPDDALMSVSSSGTLTYLHSDRLGSIVATSDNSGAVTNKNLYNPYGGGTVAGSSIGFTGQRFDSELGLYYFKNRYYSPTIGRFLQTDPSGYTALKLPDCGCGCSDDDDCTPRELNLYSYVQNSPLRYTDPFGLEPQDNSPSSSEGGGLGDWCTRLCAAITDNPLGYIICLEACQS